jgi:hypothetical protein
MVEEMHEDMNQESAPEATTLAVYQVVTSRRLAFDTMMWQVPSLSLTAQAFLLTISLSADSSWLARVVSSGLGIVVMAMCLQLMAKFRHLVDIDSLMATELEKDFEKPAGKGTPIHLPPRQRARVLNVAPKWLIALSSYRLWMIGLALFLIADLAIAVFAIVAPQIFA